MEGSQDWKEGSQVESGVLVFEGLELVLSRHFDQGVVGLSRVLISYIVLSVTLV